MVKEQQPPNVSCSRGRVSTNRADHVGYVHIEHQLATAVCFFSGAVLAAECASNSFYRHRIVSQAWISKVKPSEPLAFNSIRIIGFETAGVHVGPFVWRSCQRSENMTRVVSSPRREKKKLSSVSLSALLSLPAPSSCSRSKAAPTNPSTEARAHLAVETEVPQLHVHAARAPRRLGRLPEPRGADRGDEARLLLRRRGRGRARRDQRYVNSCHLHCDSSCPVSLCGC